MASAELTSHLFTVLASYASQVLDQLQERAGITILAQWPVQEKKNEPDKGLPWVGGMKASTSPGSPLAGKCTPSLWKQQKHKQTTCTVRD